MKTIAIHLQKGGVGKTSITGAIAYEASIKNKKTLIVDADPQGNLTNWFSKNISNKIELASMLYGQENVTPLKIEENLFLLPTSSLSGQLKLYGENQLSNEPFVFCDLLDELKQHEFDLVIFDLSPGMSRLEKSVLIAVDEVITPMIPEYFSLDGLEIFHK